MRGFKEGDRTEFRTYQSYVSGAGVLQGDEGGGQDGLELGLQTGTIFFPHDFFFIFYTLCKSPFYLDLYTR